MNLLSFSAPTVEDTLVRHFAARVFNIRAAFLMAEPNADPTALGQTI